jgi:uncharacterized protein Yka (UPF0111/DUF47 family)
MSRLSRKNVDYFGMFDIGMDLAHQAALQLQASLAGGVVREIGLKQIRAIRHESDAHVRRCLEAVDVAFVTPFDRSDIVELVRKIDRLTGGINAAADRLYILQVKTADAYLLRYAESIATACRTLKTMTELLGQHKKNRKKIDDCVVEVNRCEDGGDTIFSDSMIRLFAHERDAAKLIRQKDLYELMKDALRRCGDIADTVEQILVAKT